MKQTDLVPMTVKLSEGMIKKIDARWKERGFPSRSEYTRYLFMQDIGVPA